MPSHFPSDASPQATPTLVEAAPKHDYLSTLIKTRSAGALCQGLRIRGAAPRLISRFNECVARSGLGSAQTSLWREDLPILSDDPAADRRRTLELMRPINTNGVCALRGALLEFADGVADLIIVASRRFIDAAAIRDIATLLTGEAVPDACVPLVVRSPEAAEIDCNDRAASIPEWGLGGQPPKPGYGEMKGRAFNAAVSPQRLVEAISLVLTRFEARTSAGFGMLGNPAGARARGIPHARLLSIGIEQTATVSDLASAVHMSLVTGSATEEPAGITDAAVGIVWSVERDARDGETEFRSYQTPPFALSIEPHVRDGRVIGITYGFDRGCFSTAMVQTFDSAVASVCEFLEREHAEGASRVLASIGLLDAASAADVAACGARKRLPSGFKPFRIEQRIAAFAASQSDARAVTYEHRSLSYRELDGLSDQIAGVLGEIGVREGDRVGVCLDRSLELVPVMLAVFKAGAAYVPLDPAYPADRIAYTLTDARPALVVGAPGALPTGLEIRSIDLDTLLARAACFAGPLPQQPRSASAGAYVIYTSGSTGRPKGVVVPHRNVASLVAATEDDFALSSADTWTMFHSSAFDFSVWEIWGCLATGGHLVVVPYWITRSPEEYAQLLAREAVTVLNQTPSAFAQLLAAESRAEQKLAVRLVIFGGEALDARMLLRWFDRYPEPVCRLVNMFGITETTVHVTAETITRTHALANSRVVGRALPGWHVYVMDVHRHPLPLGVPGEVYVGGVGVANHYLNREDLNKQRFLSDPFADGRMYRSGDRGRLLKDGRLEHLGRLDSQVKIRGFRIELDEIRAVLLECPYVSAAAVVANRSSADDAASARLDAYVVLASGTVAGVRRHAANVLPEHMLPSTVTPLQSLPLTANGKLDAARLPTPKFGSSSNKASRESPGEAVRQAAPENSGGSLLEALRQIWSNVLDLDVGPDDNFFDLGGNSLYAVRLATAMRDQGLPALPLRELYLRQTLREIAGYLDSANAPEAREAAQQ